MAGEFHKKGIKKACATTYNLQKPGRWLRPKISNVYLIYSVIFLKCNFFLKIQKLSTFIFWVCFVLLIYFSLINNYIILLSIACLKKYSLIKLYFPKGVAVVKHAVTIDMVTKLVLICIQYYSYWVLIKLSNIRLTDKRN